ncbi:MAG: GNAT family N-acetyltransferase [Gemmatimonadales bacterium]
MPIALRYRDEPVSGLAPVAGMLVAHEQDVATMAALQGRPESVIRERFEAGHRAYVASLDGVAAAWGWVATATATIGEVEAAFRVDAQDRYLWNFVTRAAFRGKGIYPRLLDAIVEAEAVSAERFWIVYAPENHASGAGIRKAGFGIVAELSFDASGRPVVKDAVPGGARVAARMLGLPESVGAVSPCWKCARAGKAVEMSCAAGTCSCDYQQQEVACG